jgi:hypothetical protein
MPENETQWRNREREFQKAVLAALQKPKRNRFIAIINSGIFLWLISAIALSFGSTVYQARQQCLQESASQIMRQLRTQNEINERVFHFKEVVLSAKTPQQLQNDLRKRKVRTEQFRSKMLFDLLQDQGDIITYLPMEDRIKLAQRGLESPTLQILAAQAELDDIDDATFKELKEAVTEQSPVLPNFTMYISQCDVLSAIRLAISGNHEYLRAIPFDRP